MRYLAVMLLAFIATSCIVREAIQYEGEMVELVEIGWEMRIIQGEWRRRTIYIYEPIKRPGLTKHLTYPLDNSLVIGSRHLMPIQR